MKLTELVRRTRQALSDFGPYAIDDDNWMSDDDDMLWKNAELAQYLDQAQVEYTRRYPIPDKTTASVCNISVTAATAEYAYSPLIWTIERVKLSGVDGALTQLFREELDEALPDTWEAETGEPTGYLLDQDNRQIRLYPIPEVAYTATLWVGRKPLYELDWKTAHRALEIPEIDQPYLIHYARHLAYLRDDTEETMNETRSEYFRNLFDQTVGADISVGAQRARATLGGRRKITRTYW